MVVAIWRYPLKSAQGESVGAAHFGVDGPDGDRSWACVSGEGNVVSAKNPRRWGRLLQVYATLEHTPAGTVTWVHVPDGQPLAAGSPEADRSLSAWLGEPVTLTDRMPAEPRMERTWPTEPGMIADWAAARPGSDEVGRMQTTRFDGRFVDFGAVHLVTTDELAELERDVDEADVRRFRPNLVLELERALCEGESLCVGSEVVLRVAMPTPRCAMPGAEQRGLARAPEVLRALGRRRAQVGERGRAACLGHYADVIATGTVTLGDRVRFAR